MRQTIGLHDLRIDCIIGVFPFERELVRAIYVDVEVDTDVTAAVSGDDIAHSVDYAALAELLTRIAQEGQFQLLETFGERAAQTVLADYPAATRVSMEIRKPGAVLAAKDSFVRIERTQ